MSEIFLKVLNMSIAASWLILAVVLLRLVLKRAPKWIAVLLWCIVALRLAVPFSFESALSLIPSAETFDPHNIQYETPAISSGIPAVNNAINPVLGETFAPDPSGSVNPLYAWTFVVSVIWLIGIAAMLLYAVISYVRVRRSVAERIPYKENIFLCDHVKSPFILGLVRPKIYLPSGMEATAMEPVIAHEKAHLARCDQWWKPMGFLILAIHWFNPLCWVAYVLLCRDIELACDEKVIRQMDLDGKKQYSTALLECNAGRRLVTICPLAFGEVGVKERVKNVLNYKKPAFWIIVVAVIACAVVTVCFATNPQNTETADYTNIQDAQFSLNEDGCVVTTINGEIVQISAPVPVPAEWAGQDLAGRDEATTLSEPTYFCAGAVSPTVGWLVISYLQGMAIADTYVYRTADGGLTWTETNSPVGTEDNYTWLPGQVGFLSADRLLIAYRLYNGTPVFLTKDGGATWEALEMPQDLAYEVENIRVDGNAVTISLSGDAGSMVSRDLGDTWELELDAKGSDKTSEEAVSTTISAEQAAIRRAILEHNKSSYPQEYDVACCSFVTLETISGTPLAGSSTHNITYYGWALYEEYKVTDGGLETVSGSHTPVALSFNLGERGYTLTEYWEPRDGSYYAQDIREYFPSHIVEDSMDNQKFILRQTQECYAQAVASTGLDTNKVIGTLIETICSSPALSSNPEDYINEHPVEYRELTYYGRYTLKYCFDRFETGNETGLDSHIMMLACEDIAVGWGESLILEVPAETGQEWYNAFKSNALNLMAQFSEMELAERYPASYLLLSMLGKL